MHLKCQRLSPSRWAGTQPAGSCSRTAWWHREGCRTHPTHSPVLVSVIGITVWTRLLERVSQACLWILTGIAQKAYVKLEKRGLYSEPGSISRLTEGDAFDISQGLCSFFHVGPLCSSLGFFPGSSASHWCWGWKTSFAFLLVMNGLQAHYWKALSATLKRPLQVSRHIIRPHADFGLFLSKSQSSLLRLPSYPTC